MIEQRRVRSPGEEAAWMEDTVEALMEMFPEIEETYSFEELWERVWRHHVRVLGRGYEVTR